MATMAMPTTQLPSGESIAVLGQGTWHLGVGRHPAQEEIAALRLGLSLGMTLVDTAEMYGDGASERLVGRALAGRRDVAFLVSKVLPHHATRRGTIEACERSLRRLDTDHLDLYLLHWRGEVPLEETVEAFDALLAAGWIRHWGVSNFDVGDMAELRRVRGGTGVDCDQVLYNLAHRGIEAALLPWCRSTGVPIMAYSPIEQGRLTRHPAVARIAARRGATGAQVALAWVLLHDGVSAIPEAGTREHVAENRAALDLRLTSDDIAELDEAFPPPAGPRPLEVI
jgi:diketogulonate reductase-like aldo/keto reductase